MGRQLRLATPAAAAEEASGRRSGRGQPGADRAAAAAATPALVEIKRELTSDRAPTNLPQLKKGLYAKTAEGQVGVVLTDPEDSEVGFRVKLRLADGSEPDYEDWGSLGFVKGYIKVDRLTGASAAEYEAEAARWATLRAQFKKGVHAKTAEGQVGMVVEDAVAEGAKMGGGGWQTANVVQLRCSTGRLYGGHALVDDLMLLRWTR